jgi:spore coat protein A
LTLTPFVDPLPTPRVLQPVKRECGTTYYEVVMKPTVHQFHSELPPTPAWGYEGEVPGPTIEARRGETVVVNWINKLPDKHFLPIDHTLHACHDGMPEVRTVVHLHGAEVEADSDGYPEAWYTNDCEQIGPCFKQTTYTYPNNQRATTLWYHDHAIGITRLNVYAGLAGLYIIRDEQEEALGLPAGTYEIPLVIQDRSFNEDGTMFYPSTPLEDPPPDFPNPSVVPGFSGDFITVNGKVWPHLEVEQKKYRFRILNASNQRFYRLLLDENIPFIQIGSDGGLLQTPVRINELVIGPSERADVIMDFSRIEAGKKIVLRNTARTPFDFGAPPDPNTTGLVMEFRVVRRTSDDDTIIPPFLSYIEKYKECDAKVVRDISLDASFDKYGRLKFLLSNRGFIDRITETPILDEVEIWRIFNAGPAVHPIHIHLIQFQVLDRIPFDVDTYNRNGQIRFTGSPVPPEPQEAGWKDTIATPPGFITRLIMKFAPYTGRYVYHCHILEHEDYDMMRALDVLPPDKCKRKCK